MHIKYFLSIAMGLIVAAGFVATQPIASNLSIVSALSILAFAAPSFYVVLRWLGWKYGAFVLICLGVYALLIETFAIITSFPYGEFSYGQLLDYKILGHTPWTVAFAWTPIMLFALSLSRYAKSTISYWLLTIIALVAVDLVLDPAAVALQFWAWDNPGAYYGVPLINFIGWVISGTIAFGLFQALTKSRSRIPASAVNSGVGILIFWTTVNIVSLQWIPAGIGLVLCFIAVRFLMRNNLIYLNNRGHADG